MATTHLLYLHGFRSSPQSAKARQMQAWVQAHRPDVHWWCPQLPPSPREAMAQVEAGIAAWPRDSMVTVGSSLGGFYATWVAEQTGCRAALLNPAIHPARDLAKYIGEQTSWHDPEDRFFFWEEFVDELRTLDCPTLTRPERYFALICKGDEVLDWHEMHSKYAACPGLLLEGGDHAISDFGTHMPAVLAHLGLQPAL
ncbi:YqiA/YcfP family alpha/beta fold hydrolase [Curvibacter sp. APW13]|uniref:YqiA/YcfP family alpha/beta fold hydrolase n=1 Tax=Curvibacter sp. APW13 TaxID=3077236 RepID=UPI0028DDF51E|nr:YqiA/YcfP family alpha/beta fold hydrolase [Curvibacter sp. APW13]MDT8989784.1 YqiA/YcfP family alpha/beta fold hydrolase [Curvibacter sp. APW13]